MIKPPGIILNGAFWRESSVKVKKGDVYPKGEIEESGRAKYLLKKYPNCYADFKGIGVDTRWDKWAYEAFLKCAEKRRQNLCVQK